MVFKSVNPTCLHMMISHLKPHIPLNRKEKKVQKMKPDWKSNYCLPSVSAVVLLIRSSHSLILPWHLGLNGISHDEWLRSFAKTNIFKPIPHRTIKTTIIAAITKNGNYQNEIKNGNK